MPSDPETIGQLLRYLRGKAGLTLGDVADLCGVNVVNVSAAERHQRIRLKDCVHPRPTATQVIAHIGTDRVLHPYGRCTCGGEGTCAWHRGRCQKCTGSGLHPNLVACGVASVPCPDCEGTGRQDAEADWDRAEKERERLERKLLDEAESREKISY